jgi:redox-regulated HSP33 family molecular chaperone
MWYEKHNKITRLYRQMLEQQALKQVCACLYYDLADCLNETSDQELIDIINHHYDCDSCSLKGVKS